MATERASPSFEEMKVGLGLKSKSGVHRLIHGLIERGHIELLPGRKRAIRLAGHKALAMFSLDELEAEVERRKSGSDTLSILRAA